MAYPEYSRLLPDGSTQAVLEVTASARQNMDGLVDALIMGGTYKGVDMVVAGDPDQPDFMEYGSGPARVWMGILWNDDGNPTSISYYSSRDSGNTWDLIGKKVVTWDSDGNATQTDWDYEVSSTGLVFYTDFNQATLAPHSPYPTPG